MEDFQMLKFSGKPVRNWSIKPFWIYIGEMHRERTVKIKIKI